VSDLEFRYEPGPGEPLAARLGHYPPERDTLLDALRAVARPAVSGMVRAAFRVEVAGAVPDVPRLALLPNHQSHLDTLAVFAAMPDRFRRRITLLAAKDYFFERWPTALGVSLIGRCASFDRASQLSELRRWARLLEHADDGWFLVYPSGSRTHAEAHPGLALILTRSGFPVLPVALAGTATAWPVGHALPRPGSKVRVTFGDVLEARSAKDLVDELAGFWGANGGPRPEPGPAVDPAPPSAEVGT
jgi:1-acyl-sn-glycerol-3-phosphate acyltransferase